MQITSIFHVFVSLMVILIINLPCMSLAQQNTIQQQAIADAEQDVLVDVNGNLWFLGGCLGNITVLIIASVFEPHPPASRLLGKSPEYIAVYTDTYRRKASNLQTSRALAGCLTGTAVACVGYSFLIIATINESSGSGYYW
ncbi:hypothetical protein C6497_03850 [Candidatus Poribacteria bacterium]|nr:MAG: hypothetical protein C6497_03850 [Candidatus Poribacteria bacterium]